MLGHQPAQRAGGASDQHGSVGVPPDRRVLGGGPNTTEPGHPHGARTQGGLRLAGADNGGHEVCGLGSRVQVDQHDPVRVLRLRGTDEPPHRGSGKIGHIAGDRTAGQHDEPAGGEAFVGQPVLELRQHAVHGPVTECWQHNDVRTHRTVQVGDRLAQPERFGAEHGPTPTGRAAESAGFPVQAVQGLVVAGAGEFRRDHGAQRERADRQHRSTRAVGHLDRHRTADCRGHPDPQGGRAGGEQLHLGPSERQQHLVASRSTEPDGLQRGVKQRGVQPELGGVGGR